MVACLGFGMMFGGTIAYLGKHYNATLNANTGKVVGSWMWWVPFCFIYMQFIIYLLSGTLAWALIVACIAFVVGLLWWFRVPAILP